MMMISSPVWRGICTFLMSALLAALGACVRTPNLYQIGGPAPEKALTGPNAAQQLLAAVRVEISEGEQGTHNLLAAGFVIGARRDSIFILTANHHVRPNTGQVSAMSVQLDAKLEPTPAFHTDCFNRELDLAVVGVKHRTENLSGYHLPRILLLDYHSSIVAHNTRVFSLGCPDGACWRLPDEAHIAEIDSSRLRFRSFVIAPGYSGGLLVDEEGAVVGIIVQDTPPSVEAVRWDVVLQFLKACQIELDLQPRWVERKHTWHGGVSVAALPNPAQNLDSTRIQRGFRAEAAYRASRHLDMVAAFQSLSFNGWNEEGFRALAGNFIAAGVRHVSEINWALLGSSQPDVAFIGLERLFPVYSAIRQQVVIPDSFDLSTGAPATLQSVRNISVDGFVATAGYKSYLKWGFGLQASVSLFLMDSGRDPIDVPTTLQLMFGFTTRLPDLFTVPPEDECPC